MPRTLRPARTRRSRPRTVPFNVRIPEPLLRDIRSCAEQQRTSASAVATRLLEEGIRTARFPGIDFRDTPSGRQPFIVGTGLTVWELLMIWRDHKRDARYVLENYPHLREQQVRAGVAYAEAFREEAPRQPAVPPWVRVVKI